MKFYLAKNEQLNLHLSDVLRSKHGFIRRQVISANVRPTGDSEEEKQFCEKVNSKLRQVNEGNDDFRKSFDRRQLILSIASIDGLKGVVGIADGFGNILEKLTKIFDDGALKMEVIITNFRELNIPSPERRFNIFTKELSVYHRDHLSCFASDEAEFQFDNLRIMRQFREEDSQLGGAITIAVNIAQSSVKCDNCADKFQVYKRMLEGEICSDAVIMTREGIQVKCHKGILGAQSSVLKAMMQQTNMEEAKTGIVEIPDMSEQSLNAFLAYLYHWDEGAAKQSSQVAYDLFHAGHKYDIPSLEKAMENVLLSKPNQWYDTEVALKLFLFARNLSSNTHLPGNTNTGGHQQLKMKAIKVLKLNYSTLETLPSYDQLFKDEPQAAKELCKCVFLSG